MDEEKVVPAEVVAETDKVPVHSPEPGCPWCNYPMSEERAYGVYCPYCFCC